VTKLQAASPCPVPAEPAASSLRLAVILILIAGLLSHVPGVHAQSGGVAGNYCWAPGQLRAKRGESKVRITRRAYRSVPEGGITTSKAQFEPTGKVLRRVDLPPGKKLVAFTFDLCEQPFEIAGYQGDIVDYLREHNVPATFFAGGKWLLTHPERAAQLLGDPLFEVANHAWEHRFFPLLNRARMDAEISAAQLAYEQVYNSLRDRHCLAANDKPAFQNAAPQQRLFRFPFGACTPEAIEAVESYGLRAVQWDVSSSDPWRGQSRNGIVKSVLKRMRPGSIVLFHANGRGWKTAEALPILIKKLRKRGYEFAQVSKLIAAGQPVYADKCYDFREGDVNRHRPTAVRLERSYDRFYKRLGKHQPRRLQSAPGPSTQNRDFFPSD
jgi:peptidoglycan-N-acetylglucosamine deacetylase